MELAFAVADGIRSNISNTTSVTSVTSSAPSSSSSLISLDQIVDAATLLVTAFRENAQQQQQPWCHPESSDYEPFLPYCHGESDHHYYHRDLSSRYIIHRLLQDTGTDERDWVFGKVLAEELVDDDS